MNKKNLIVSLFLFCYVGLYGQIVNYVSNGSFEECVNCSTQPYIAQPKCWTGIDSGYAFMYCSLDPPLSNLPYFASGYQYPRTGKNIIGSTIYCDQNTCMYTNSRAYPRNRLKQRLKANTPYCVKYYAVNFNYNTIAIDAFGAYFGDESIDTIKYCSLPLLYLTPQIQNTSGNIITDTSNWTAITGTFTASGNEKYMVIGNFKSNAATNTLLINPSQLPSLATDIFFDDVSVIELNLPAFAGHDTSISSGANVFLGRQPDVGINEACIWYKMTSPTTSITIDTIAGIWVNPIVTTTYVVRQEIDCSVVKLDTVVVYMNLVGIEKLRMLNEELRIYPVPAKDFIELNISNQELVSEFNSVSICNSVGLLLKEEEIFFINSSLKIKIEDLPNGVYSLQLKSNSNETVNKRFVISR